MVMSTSQYYGEWTANSHGVENVKDGVITSDLPVSVVGQLEEEGNSTYYSPPGQCLYRLFLLVKCLYVQVFFMGQVARSHH